MNKLLLKSVMVRENTDQRTLAELIGVTEQTFSSKMTGKTEFTCREATIICEELHLGCIESAQIFLS